MAHKDLFTIRVVSCSNPHKWYAHEIGNMFKVQEWLGMYIALDRIKGKIEPCFSKEDIEFI